MLDIPEQKSLQLKNKKLIAKDNNTKHKFPIAKIEDFSVSDDFTPLKIIDLLIQSFFSIVFVLLLFSFTLILFVGIDLGSTQEVINSLKTNNIILTLILFLGGITASSTAYLYYYYKARQQLLNNYNPTTSIIEFSINDREYSFRNVEQETVDKLIQETSLNN